MKRYRIVLLPLLAALLCTVLAGCSKQNNQPQDSGTGQDSATEEPLQTLTVASDGSTEMTLWLAKSLWVSAPEVREQLSEISKAVEKKTGAVLRIRSDADAKESDRSRPGILIGNTDFAESSTPDKTLRNQDFCVSQIGNKILLYGASAKGTASAARYFLNYIVLKQKAENKTLYFQPADCFRAVKTYDIASLLCADREIGAAFRIVLPRNAGACEQMLANLLRHHLSVHYGYDLEIGNDDSTTDYEIRIGKTARTTKEAAGTGFRIAVTGGSMELTAATARGYEAMTEYLLGTMLAAGSGADYSFPEGWSHDGTAPGSEKDGTVLAGRAPDGIRVMFYNVYGYTQSGPTNLRQQFQAGLIADYAPDVVGLQEFSASYRAAFPAMLESIGYRQVSSGKDNANFTPLFYRADRLEVVDSGYKLYTGPNDNNSKSLTWAIFRVRETGKRFVAISTHFMWNQPGIDGPAARLTNAREMLELIATLRSREGCADIPVIFGGDLNCNPSSNALQTVVAGGLTEAWNAAAQKNDTSGYHQYATYDETWGIYTQIPQIGGTHANAIDHAFVTAGTQVNRCYALISPYTLYASDHMPIFIDIEVD